MKPLTINFAWRREQNAERIAYLALALALVIALGLGWRDIEVQRELNDLLSERQTLQPVPEASRSVALSPEDSERQRAELKMAQGIIERLDTPWGTLFAAVESAFDDQVTLLNVEPEPEHREVRLTAEAKDMQAMQAYIRQLAQSRALKDAHLASHQINQQDPLRPVRFVANARWVVPTERAAMKMNGKAENGAEVAAVHDGEMPDSSAAIVPEVASAKASVSVAPVVKKAGE